MISQWRTLEDQEAEAHFRGLQRRLVDLEAALAAQGRISESDPTSFAARLSLVGLLRMQEYLLNERAQLLRDRQFEVIKIRFDGKAFEQKAANFEALGWFLVRFQKLLDAVGQAISSGPTRRGPIANETRRLTELRFQESFASSFGIQLTVRSNYDLFGESISVSAVRSLFQMLNSQDQEAATRRQLGELGERTFRHLRRLLDDLVKSSDDFALRWEDVGGTSYEWSESSSKLAQFSSRLQNLRSSTVREFEIDAYLGGVSLIRQRFEAVNLETRDIIEGRISRQAFAVTKDNFAKTVKLFIREVETINRSTNDIDRAYTLLDVKSKTIAIN